MASHNPQGVPHAEMEQWIRDAWQIFANEFTYTGVTVGGVQYIKANNGCPYDCTEGDGYALLAAAYMGDKATFDGIWMRFHDLRLNYRPRYQDGVVPNAAYLYGNNPKDNTDSAADGDFDAALGILMAYYQWGANSGITVFGGGTLNYQTEALYALDALVAQYRHFPVGDCRVTTGDIGFDGYIKGGNTWNEMTNWANGCPNPQYNGPNGPEFGGPTGQYVDYAAPAYFNCFASFLMSQGYAASSWDVVQFQRATASSDWLMGQWIGSAATAIPFVGRVNVAGTTATFSNVGQAEDDRFGWRTILNYVWNGNPATSWDPANHVVTAAGNTSELAGGQRFAAFLADPQGPPWNNACQSYGGAPAGLTFQGPATVNWSYTGNGVGGGSFNLNWLMGTGSPAAVAAQNFGLMAKLFRQCTLEWDVSTAGDGYLTSVPVYMHGFFRWLGMDILTGNHLDPCDLVPPGGAPPANLKIYKSVDRTFAFTGDTITYWLSYRNYASTPASGVVVTDTLPAELGFISSVPAASSAPAVGANGVVRWALAGLVPGLQNQNVAATTGGITLVAQVLAGTGRFCNTVDISCSNGSGWTSNEFPNEVSTVMRRNCVDIVPQVMSLTQTAAPAVGCVGDKVTFTINFKDNPSAWLNGGRPNVVVSYAYDTGGNPATASNQLNWKIRLMHAADEPYIDYGNYRISYFLNNAANPPGSWGLTNTIYEGGTAAGVTVVQQALPPGPTWNQRVIVQFAPQLAATAIHLFNYTGLLGIRIHKGGAYTLRAVWQMHNSAWSNVNWTGDWSYDPAATNPDGGLYFPVTDDWTAGNGTSVPVTTWDPESCQTAPHTVNNVLVEEWDGYTWRRAFGNGPVAGRQLSNVVISDTLPACFTFGGFLGAPAGMTATAVGQNLTWTMANMNINEADQIQYWVTVGSCGGTVNNTAVFSATGEKTIFSSVPVNPGAACGGTPTDTPTRTRTATPSPTGSPTATATPTASPSASPTASPSPTPSSTPSSSPSPSGTPTASPSCTISPSPSASPSGSPTATPSFTASPLATATNSPTASPTFSVTPTGTPSATPSVTRTASGTATPSATLSATPSASPSASPPFTPTSSPTVTPTSTDSPVYSPTATPSATPTFTATPTATPSGTPSWTPTASPTLTSSATLTASPSLTATPTATTTRSPSATLTASATPSATPTVTASFTASATATPTRTLSPSFTASPSQSVTPTVSPTFTVSATFTVSPTKVVNFYQQPALIRERAVYPNPFREVAHFYFTLRTAAQVTLTVFNVAGEVIYQQDFAGRTGPNDLPWPGVNNAGGRCASGIYVCTLKAQGIDGSSGNYWTEAACAR